RRQTGPHPRKSRASGTLLSGPPARQPLRLASRRHKRVGLHRLAVLLDALIEPVERSRALVELDFDGCAGSDPVQSTRTAQAGGEFLVLDVDRHGVRLGSDLVVKA